MAEYIEHETVRNTIKALCEKYNQAYGGNYGGFGEELAKSIDNMPVSDVEPVRRGRWVWEANYRDYDGDIYSVYSCSVCGVKNDETTNYCKNCGAKMKGEENG